MNLHRNTVVDLFENLIDLESHKNHIRTTIVSL